MKYAIPEISWHNRDPVLSVDFQPKCGDNEPLRVATGGTDSHVLIWHLSVNENGSVNLEVAADLTRHQKAVNIVRWSPDGQYLASGDDEAIIFIWKQNTEKELNGDQLDEQYKESWMVFKTLRGHMEDVLDISWSPDSKQLASGSVDNKLIVWDVARARSTNILTDHKGFVQGVCWDPRGQIISTMSSDRVFRAFDVTSKKVISRSSKAILPLPATHHFHGLTLRLYHDDTLQTFFRRLDFSPDGILVAVPSGTLEGEQGKVDGKPVNAVLIYTRYNLKVPTCILPTDSPPLLCRWSPILYKPSPSPALPLPSRAILAVASKGSVFLYDTQQKTPLGIVSNIHYTRLTDMSWSPNGQTLMVSSTDGFCSVISFTRGELGEELPAEKVETVRTEQKSPPQKEVKRKVPVKIDVMEEVAMPSWSENSNIEIIRPKVDEAILIEDSEDIKLVYEDTQNKSTDSIDTTKTGKEETKMDIDEKKTAADETKMDVDEEKVQKNEVNDFLKQAKVTDVNESVKVIPSPKAPRRVSFVTLTSPKNSKKKL